jgi:hypothetical protein
LKRRNVTFSGFFTPVRRYFTLSPNAPDGEFTGMAESRVIDQAMETTMTTASTLSLGTVRRRSFATRLQEFGAGIRTSWSLYRTQRILSGLDERTLKDIGAPALDRAASSADPRVLRHLDSLR